MTRLTIERFDPPATTRSARVAAWAGDRAADALAGRTVWGAAASPDGRAAARALGDRLREPGDDMATDPLDVSGGERLRALAQRLDEMLAGVSERTDLGEEERALCREAADAAEALVGGAVGRDDVVVVHDALTALLAQAVHERGAHTVWHVHVTGPQAPAAARAAHAFLRHYTAAVDAYIMTWPEPAGRGRTVEHVAAAMPSSDVVADKGIVGAERPVAASTLAWRTALADVVVDDREPHVGGTIRVRPAVAAR
jgi:hypothetical protein